MIRSTGDVRADALQDALEQIEALDRQGHDSKVAAEMGYIARMALNPPAKVDQEEWSDLYAKDGIRRGVRCESEHQHARCMNIEGHSGRHRHTSGADGRSISWD